MAAAASVRSCSLAGLRRRGAAELRLLCPWEVGGGQLWYKSHADGRWGKRDAPLLFWESGGRDCLHVRPLRDRAPLKLAGADSCARVRVRGHPWGPDRPEFPVGLLDL